MCANVKLRAKHRKQKPHIHTDHTRVRYAIKCEGGKEERSSRPKSWKTNLKMLLNIDPHKRKPIVDVVILLVPLNSHTRFPPPAPSPFHTLVRVIWQVHPMGELCEMYTVEYYMFVQVGKMEIES